MKCIYNLYILVCILKKQLSKSCLLPYIQFGQGYGDYHVIDTREKKLGVVFKDEILEGEKKKSLSLAGHCPMF